MLNVMLKLTVTTVERQVVSLDNVTQVTLPTKDGEITVLPGHVPLMSVAGRGAMEITQDNGEVQHLFIDGGTVQVNQTQVEVLTHLAETSDELDEAKILEAKRRAEKLLEEKPVDVDLAKIEVSLQRELAKEKLVKKWKDYK
jgi:F-type H+-transporting ATPase subunit epsilon